MASRSGLTLEAALVICVLAGPPAFATATHAACDFTPAELGVGFTGVVRSSVAWGDYDNDGDLDILLTGHGATSNVAKVYRNSGGANPTFNDVGAALTGVDYSSAAWGDYDNDGDLDILLTGYDATSVQHVSKVYRNGGGANPTFTDVGAALTGVAYSSVAWGDYDNDGDLDILLTGYDDGFFGFSRVYRNGGGADPKFSEGPWLPGVGESSVAWGDYDNDGDLDILLTGRTEYDKPFGTGVSGLYRNSGGANPTFSFVDAGLLDVEKSSVAWGDYDNDGNLDILLTGLNLYFPPGLPPARTHISLLYRNSGGANPTFSDAGAGLTGVSESSVAWGDYDNDGDLDILLTGAGGTSSQPDNVWKLYRNSGGPAFAFGNVLPDYGVFGAGSVAWGDYDNDGDLDMLLTGGWADQTASGITAVYRNESCAPNTPPTAPTGLTATQDTTGVTFSWNASSDAETPAAGLTYNLRVGTTPFGNEIVSGMAAMNGYRRVARHGNAQHRLSWTLALPPSTYYWTVQAVDGAFQGSPPGFPIIGVISDATITEGPNGTQDVVLTATLASASAGTVMVQYATQDGTAVAGEDYVATSGTLTFNPGVISQPISITVSGDYQIESDETFFVLSAPPGYADIRGTVTIQDDERVTLVGDLYQANSTVRAMAVDGGTIYIGGDFTQLGRPTGGAVGLDAGAQAVVLPKVLGTVHTIVPDGTGGWFLGGLFTHVGGFARANLARVTSNGSVLQWNPGAGGDVFALAASAGVVYVGGAFTTAGGQPRSRIAALDGATGAVTAWNPGADADVRALVVSGSTVYAGGAFTIIGGVARNFIAALDASSGAPTSFNASPEHVVRALAVKGDTVFVGGQFITVNTMMRHYLAAVNATTGALLGWNPDAGSSVSALVCDGGTLYAGGLFTTIGGSARTRLAAFDAESGSLLAWNPAANSTVNALAVDAANVYVGGSFTTLGGLARAGAGAVDRSTGVATSWDPKLDAGGVNAVATGGGAVWIGGGFSAVDMTSRNRLAALDATTGAPTSWNPNVNAPVNAIVVDGATVYAGGSFTIVGGAARPRIAALDAATGAAAAWNPAANSTVHALAVSGATVYAGGDFTSIGGQVRNKIAALNAASGTATAWNPNSDNIVYALAMSGGTIYAGGSFLNMGGQQRRHVAAVDAVSGVATPWDADADGPVRSLAIRNGTLYAGGFFFFVGEEIRPYLAALDAASGAVTSWAPELDGEVFALSVAGNKLYAGGDFTSVGVVDDRIAAIDATSGLADPGFVPAVNGVVRALAATGSEVIVGGEFSVVANLPQKRLARLLVPALVAVGESGPGAPADLEWALVSPNPTTGLVRLAHSLPQAGRVRIAAYDLQGRRVAKLLDAERPAGRHETVWDARSEGLAPGLYFLRFETPGRTLSRRLVLVR